MQLKLNYRINNHILWILNIAIALIGYFLVKEFYYQRNIAKSLQVMQNQLIDTALPLTNLFSKSMGNININNETNITPVLHYSHIKNTHKLELNLLNANYNFIDCLGELTSNVIYPIKVKLIWSLQPNTKDQYNLICESYSYSKNKKLNNKHHKKLLLNNISAVRFRFLEQDGVGSIRAIDPKKLHKDREYINDTRIISVQIGMILRSEQEFYPKLRHNWHNLFDERINFLDKFMRKVIYFTINSNLT
jgi:hypothetical protein